MRMCPTSVNILIHEREYIVPPDTFSFMKENKFVMYYSFPPISRWKPYVFPLLPRNYGTKKIAYGVLSVCDFRLIE